MRSRHAAPSWAAVYGKEPFSDSQVKFAEDFHPGSVNRGPNALVALEGSAAAVSGCALCHAVGKPNKEDGTIGTCTACHTRHTASAEMASAAQTVSSSTNG